MDWFDKATAKLLSNLEQSTWVDGTSFLRDFLLEEVEYFTGLDEEEQDLFIIKEIDNFEHFLSKKAQKSILIEKRYRWFSKSKVTKKKKESPPTIPETIVLNEGLLAVKVDDLTEEQAEELLTLTTSLLKARKFVDGYKYGNKHYELAKYQRLPDSEILSRISVLIGASKGAERVDIYKLYCDKAEIYARNYEHDNAAAEYENAIRVLNNDALKNNVANRNQKIIVLFRRCRIQYENSGNGAKASETYINENKYIQKKLKCGIKKGLMFSFGLVAGYGESPINVVFSASALIILCSFIYMGTGLNPPREETASYWAHLYYSVVTFTTLGYGDFSPQEGFSRFMSAFQAVMGLIFTSLFLTSFVKKYSR